MNAKALEYSFNLFKADGYNGTLEDYKTLIKENKKALDYSYELFSSDGYDGSIEDFYTLIGVGNQQDPTKEAASVGSENQAVNGDSNLENGSLELNEYDKATKLSEEELKAIDNELGQIDFTPIKKIKIIPGGYGGMMGGTYEEVEQPYEDYLKQAKKELEREKGKEPFTNELLQEKALDIIRKEKKYNLLLNKNKEYLKDLPKEERRKITSEKIDQFRDIEWNLEDDWKAIESIADKYNNSANVKNLENLEKAFNDSNFKFDLTDAIENNKPVVVLKDGRTVPESALNAYKEAYEKHVNHISFINQSIDDYERKLEKIPELAVDVDFLNKNYNRLDKLTKIANNSMAEAGFGLYAAALELSEIYDPSSAAVMKSKKEDLNAVRKEMQKRLQEDYAPSVKFENAFDNAENFGAFFAESLAGQAGTLSMLASGNVIGLTSMATSTYGRTISDIEILDEEQKTTTSNLEKRLTALGYSAFETALGSVPTIKLLKGVGGNLSKSSTRSLYKGIGDFAKKNYKEIPNAFVTEFVSEGATQLGQNGIDVIRGEKSIQNIFDGVPEASVTGGMLGTTLSSMPILKGATLAAFSDYKKYDQFRKNAETIQVLNEEIASLDKRTNNYKNKVKLINDLTSENSQILDGIENNISNNLSPQGFELYQQRTTEQEQIRLEAEQISKRKDLSKEGKAKRLDILQSKFDALQKKRDIYKRDFKDTFSVEESSVIQKYNDLAEQALAKDDITDQAKIDKKARELYNIDKIKDRNEKAVAAIKTLKRGGIINNYDYELSNNDLTQVLKEHYDKAVENGNISETKAKKLYSENRKALLDGKVNGFNLPVFDNNNNIKAYDIYVSQENALKNGKTETAIHELGHSIFIETLGADPDAYNSFAKDIMIYLEKNNKSAFNRIIESTKGQDADEILMNFLEEVSSGRLDLDAKKNQNFVATIGLSLRNIFSKSTKSKDVFTFDGVNDITTFLTELGKKIATGQLEVKDVKAIKANKMLADNASTVNPIKQKIKKSEIPSIQKAFTELEDKMIDGEIDYNTYEAKLKELESKLEKAEKQEATKKETPKKKESKKSKKDTSLKDATAKSKKILDEIGNDPNGFNKNNPKIYEVLEGIIRSKSKVFKTAGNNIVNLTNLPGFEMENMVQETIAGLVPMINKFDPKKNDSLFGYLNSQLANKMRGALKSGKVTEQTFTEDVTQNKGLAAEETEVKTPEKPKYTKLIDADVFDTDVINSISNKMVSTVRVLKNKLTEAVGRNQSTTPLIKEILSEISTQADIDIKQAMGGKLNGEFRKFLLKNKKAIIENATTTWLMGKDRKTEVLGGLPIAIQKQVDGKFLSYPDWVGKTIDRETTTSRGNTSGNQIVRRVPANKIINEDYLDFFINPDDSPLRGRKESLAKELSGEIGLELFLEEAQAGSGPIFDAFKNNQELLGEALEDNYLGEITKQVERGLIKFSSKADVLTSIENLLNNDKLNVDEIKYIKNVYSKLASVEDKNYNLTSLLNALNIDLKKLGYSTNQERKFKARLFGELASTEIININELPKKYLEAFSKWNYQIKEIAYKKEKIDVKKDFNSNGISKNDKLKIVDNFIKTFSRPVRSSAINNITKNKDFLNELKSIFGEKFINSNYSLKKIINGETVINKNTGTPINPFTSTDYLKKIFSEELNLNNENPNTDLLSETINKEAEISKKILVDFIESNTKKHGKEDTINKLILINSDQNSLVRKLSKFGGYEANIKKGEEIIVEHVTEVSTLMDSIIDFIDSDFKNNAELNNIIDNAVVYFITKASDKKLRKTNLKGEARYDKAGIDIIKLSTSPAELNKNLKEFNLKTKSIGNLLNPSSTPQSINGKVSAKGKNKEYNIKFSLNSSLDFDWKEFPEQGARVAEFNFKGSNFAVNIINHGVYDFPSKGFNSSLKSIIKNNKLDEAAITLSNESVVIEFGDLEKGTGITNKIGSKAIKLFSIIGNGILDYVSDSNINAISFNGKDEGGRVKLYNALAVKMAEKLGWSTDFKDGTYLIWNQNDKSLKEIDFSKEFEGYKEFASNDGYFENDFGIKFSKAPVDPEVLNKEFNLMLERKTGIKAGAKISRARAEQLGSKKGKFRFFLPPNTEDFTGFLYNFLGKGKQGDKDFEFFKEYLINPFNEAENAISSFRQKLGENLKVLKKEMGDIDKDIDKATIKKIQEIGFTPDQAVRVFIWNRKGEEIPDLTNQEKAKILSIVRRDPKLMKYAKELMSITDQFGGYPPPSDSWYAGNSRSDLYKYANENVRAEYLANWQQNADAIFSKENKIKLQAIYGKNFVKELSKILGRMKSGTNRPINMNDAGSKMLDYINGSVGVIMFLNVRSAVLQTLSSVNFINWHDNNLFAAGKTLANPKNFGKTFIEIMNSDFLKQRRDGLEINVSEAEIADAAEKSKNKAKSIFSKIIKAGYKPTQFADSFAIALGGTPFLINRTKTYIEQGFSAKEAKEKAFTDFREIAEENQQSSRTDKTSNIQASNLGRLVFAFNNTPFQYTRIMKKAVLDLANGRGDIKTNISKIIYYGAVQNIIFYALQQALMAGLFGSEDEEKLNKRISRMGNGMLDTILRGSGLPGAVISTAKNVIMEYADQEAKGQWKADHGKTLIQMLNFSPPIGSKATRIYSGIKGAKYEETTFDTVKNKAKIFSAITNLPLDRLVTKTDNMKVAVSEPIETWKRIALFAGWDQWSLGIYDDLKAIEDKQKGKKKKKSRSEIMKEVWRKRKEEDKKHRDSIINSNL